MEKLISATNDNPFDREILYTHSFLHFLERWPRLISAVVFDEYSRFHSYCTPLDGVQNE
jgi:hypothetical protein